MSTETTTYTVTALIDVRVVNGTPLASVLANLRGQINDLAQDPWPDGEDDAEWWVGNEVSAVQVAYQSIGEQLAAERGRVAGPDSHLISAETAQTGEPS